jgi:hypothetical protein
MIHNLRRRSRHDTNTAYFITQKPLTRMPFRGGRVGLQTFYDEKLNYFNAMRHSNI